MTRELRTQLEDVFELLGLERRRVDVFEEYINILIKWNKSINLISKKEKDIVGNLLAPSFLFFKLTEGIALSKVADFGSGAGLPAMVIKIYEPAIEITMVEKNRKKCAFLNYAASKLNISCTIIEKNLYGMAENEIGETDIVTIRGISITKEIITKLKKTTKSKYLIYFTSPRIALPLGLFRKVEFNMVSAQLYLL